MTGAPEVLLFGGTGFTGSMLAGELTAGGIPFTIVSRDRARAETLQHRLGDAAPLLVADVTDPSSFACALDRAAVVLNCVGPYNVFGEALLTACAGRQLTYIDLCGEQEFVLRSLQRCGGGVDATILHSMAFESALADLLAAEIVRPGHSCERLASYYSFSASRPSPGTSLTMRTSGHFSSYRVTGGRLETARPLSFEEVVREPDRSPRTAVFLPYPEVLFFWHRYRPQEAASFLLLEAGEAVLAKAAARSAVPDLASIVEQHRQRRREGPGEVERRGQRFTLTVRALDTGGERVRHVSGCDMYRISVLLVLQVVEFLAGGGRLDQGVFTPAELPVWNGIWQRLHREGLIAPRGEAAA